MFHELPIWAFLIIVLALTHLTIATVTIFLHRNQAHRALELHPLCSHFFRFWLWLTTGIVTREWVAIHRKHHANVEMIDDPHSPQQVGITKVLLQGAELYRAEASNQQTLKQYGHETPDDWIERNIYSRFTYAGIFFMLMLNIFMFGAAGITIWAIQMVWIPVFAAGVINGVGHCWGYRNYESADASTNILPIGALIGGEELHNNHHAFVSSAKFSSKWYEMDLGWAYICLLQKLKLAKVKKLAPRPIINTNKHCIDCETLRAVISNRFHVMAHYTHDVIKRVYKEEAAKANRKTRILYSRRKKLLIRHELLMDKRAKQRLAVMLKENQRLREVYEFSQKLQQIWQWKLANQESLLEALQEWCRQAEQTGIQALQEFSRSIRGYSLQAV